VDDRDVESVEARLRDAGCVFAADEARILTDAASSAAELETWVTERVRGRPLEHIVGFTTFCGHRVEVASGVFVPRQRSELLVSAAVPLVPRGDVVIDLCCGSGAIGMAIAAAVPGVEVHAVDVDPIATQCAARNLAPYGGSVYAGDLVDALPTRLRGSAAVIVANAPYVPTADIAFMPSEARDHEPLVALDGGEDGVAIHRRIAAVARDWLRPGGSLLIETSRRQAQATEAACVAGGLSPTTVTDDHLDATVVVAVRPTASPA
jgi:release factor glutamine methyltransferase